ncbi:hypothetical protein [Nocardia sp. CY41]|uniref:hypothetical protein n=1 Tax=Nocardia sp. CY41 TaxID=2608686 RepID=UPI00135A7849|nr:hypothetical protein [Nocardia sp. CY41]
MNLSDTEVLAAYYALRDVIRTRRLYGVAIPSEVQRLYDRIDRVIRGDVDQDDTPRDDITDTECGTAEAAVILGYSERYVRMIAASLDGIRVGRTWIFNRRTVQEYADARPAA